MEEGQQKKETGGKDRRKGSLRKVGYKKNRKGGNGYGKWDKPSLPKGLWTRCEVKNYK